MRALASEVKFGLALRKRLLEDLGYKEHSEKIFDLWENPMDNNEITKMCRVADSLPDEAVEKVAIFGTKDDVIERIEKFNKVGVNLFMISPLLDKIRETISAYKEVIQYFKEHEI